FAMQVKGGKQVTLTSGQTFDEGPTMFVSSVGTRAVPSLQNSWCSWSRTKALRWWCAGKVIGTKSGCSMQILLCSSAANRLQGWSLGTLLPTAAVSLIQE